MENTDECQYHCHDVFIPCFQGLDVGLTEGSFFTIRDATVVTQ